MTPRFLLLLLMAVPLVAAAQTENTIPVKSGYVTAIAPAGGFNVDGVAIHITPATVFAVPQGTGTLLVPSLGPLHLGERLDVYGKWDKKSIRATQINVVTVAAGSLHGTAIIDFVPAMDAASPDRVVRADGYLLRLTPKSSLSFDAPLVSVDQVGTNVWITYRGAQQADGTVLVESATLSKNTVKHTEDNLREKNEYDPSAVDADSKQGWLSKSFLGIDPKQIPPYNDRAMEERVQRIGKSLIPAFQRALPDSDATKIDFRFHLIDSTHWHDAVSLPSGIILVPRQVVERMENDSQLATVLADNIAEVMEKQSLRYIPPAQKATAAMIAGDVGGIFIPGLGIATAVAANRVNAHILALDMQQSGRVSLFLLKEAGYDITQAPLAWWLLAPKKPKPIAKIELPARAANIYMALGTTWQSTMSPAAP